MATFDVVLTVSMVVPGPGEVEAAAVKGGDLLVADRAAVAIEGEGGRVAEEGVADDVLVVRGGSCDALFPALRATTVTMTEKTRASWMHIALGGQS